MAVALFISLFSLLLANVVSQQYCTDGTGSVPYGTPCFFPFMYKGKEYKKCTAVDNSDGGLWCSTTADYDHDKSWGGCSECDTGSEPVEQSEFCTVGGNAPLGSRCTFPFVYAEEEFNECINLDNGGSAWCATTYNYDRDGVWGDCVPCSNGTVSTIKYCADGSGSAPYNTPCVFPFTYKGVEYNECTTINNWGYPWCSTTANYDKDQLWGSCMDCSTGVKQKGKPSTVYCAVGGSVPDNTPCMFPFYYQGEPFYDCIVDDNGDQRWCGTSDADLDDDYPEWGNCVICPNATIPTPTVIPGGLMCTDDGGTAPPGSACVFPFSAFGKTYYSCTTDLNDGVPWCATSAEDSYDQQWGNCVPCEGGPVPTLTVNLPSTEFCVSGFGTAAVGTPCVFPFVYLGVRYDACTTVDNDGVPWCATSPYDLDSQEYGDCGPCANISKLITETPNPLNGQWCVNGHGTALVGSECTFPFIYRGEKYNDCTTDDNNGVPWCSVTRNFAVDKLWGNCVPCHAPLVAPPPTPTSTPVEGSSAPMCTAQDTDIPCVFPFVYNGQLHNECIRQGDTSWCSTTSSYDADMNWGYCGVCRNATIIAANPNAVCAYTGTAVPGTPCVFPFTYKGISRYECVVEATGGRSWCATSKDFDKDHQWGVCGVCPSSISINPLNPLIFKEDPEATQKIYTILSFKVPQHMLMLIVGCSVGLFLGFVMLLCCLCRKKAAAQPTQYAEMCVDLEDQEAAANADNQHRPPRR